VRSLPDKKRRIDRRKGVNTRSFEFFEDQPFFILSEASSDIKRHRRLFINKTVRIS
jgi:hypothetical protein